MFIVKERQGTVNKKEKTYVPHTVMKSIFIFASYPVYVIFIMSNLFT